jgi:glycosyltransferase involved in cell wall biosynthesis
MQKAWAYVKAAEIGLSPLPRGYLLDSASPTKAIEYLGIGLPVIANDNPDQAEVLEKSGAGICVHLNATSFANAALELLKSKKLQKEMSSRGLEYVRELRSYQYISQQLSIKYYALFKI